MTITFKSFAYGSSGSPPTDPTTTTQACTTGGIGAGALNVANGDLLVAILKWETSNGSSPITITAGANSFSMGALNQNTTDNDMWIMAGWILNATADAAATFSATWTTGVNYRRIAIVQFGGEVGKTFSLATSGVVGQGSSTSLATSSFTASGSDQVFVMGTGLYGNANYTSTTFGGVAATQPSGSPVDNSLVSYLFSGAVSGITAACAIDASQDWCINAEAFRLDAAASPVAVTYSFPSLFFGTNQ